MRCVVGRRILGFVDMREVREKEEGVGFNTQERYAKAITTPIQQLSLVSFSALAVKTRFAPFQNASQAITTLLV